MKASVAGLCLVCVALLPGVSAFAQSSRARLLPLTRAQAHAAADRIAAGKVEREALPDEHQDFLLKAVGSPDLLFVPAYATIERPAAGEPPTQCGLFQQSVAGATVYLPVVGPDFKPYSWCEQAQALGLSADPGPRPRLIAIFGLRSAAGNHYGMPFVLRWEPGSARYAVDYATSFWLAKQPGSSTVAGVRRLLRAK